MYEFLKNLDRRWIFLLMLLAVSIPILLQVRFPESPTGLDQSTFEEIEKLIDGEGRVLLSFDYDPASEGELSPMATAFVRHCTQKRLKMYFMALWPVGPQMIDDNIRRVIEEDYNRNLYQDDPLVYGEDYVNIGFKSGNEGVITVILTDIRELYTTDDKGTSIDDIPMMGDIKTIKDFDLIINVSAGYAGTKEWVQYAVTRFPDDIRLVAGCTGVQAPLLYPYIPEQLPGLLAAIKGAAGYEKLVNDKVEAETGMASAGIYLEGQRRMGPQLIAHILMVLLIIVGNIIFFIGRKREAVS